MKLQLTTLLYFISNAFFIIFRTVQILCLTESETAFLKPSSMPVNIVFVIIAFLLLSAVFINALYKPRMPKDIGAKTVPCLAVSLISGVLYAASGIVYVLTHSSGNFFLVMSLAAALACALYGFTEYSGYEFPRAATLVWIGLWVYEFILSYLFYSSKPLRFRTILETMAITFVILFFISFGKLKSGVKQAKNIRLIYPLGLVASTLCFVSLVPEFIVTVIGQSQKASESCVSQPALLAAGLFTAFISLYCFKRQPPKRDVNPGYSDDKDMPFYLEPFENFKSFENNHDKNK